MHTQKERLTREDLHGLQARIELAHYKRLLDNAVGIIYDGVVKTAEKTSEKSLYTSIHEMGLIPEFVKGHLAEILTNLRYLFPGSSVECKCMVRGPDRKFRNCSEGDLASGKGDDYIVVDWS